MSTQSTADLVLFESSDGAVSLSVDVCGETAWITQQQMAELFQRDRSVISKHIKSVFAEGELDEKGSVRVSPAPTSNRPTTFYTLDVAVSVGYRVRSQRGTEFRKWATGLLRHHLVERPSEQQACDVLPDSTMRAAEQSSGSEEADRILAIAKSYAPALDLLDDYDHQRLKRPKGSMNVYVLEYDECRRIIDNMRFTSESSLFGREKDESFKSSIAAIYQSFDGQDLYPSLEEKAANLLYFVVKNHSFHDGNKRIAASLFLYFLDRNNRLFLEEGKSISDDALVSVTILIAESRPDEKEAMISLVMNLLVRAM